MPEKLCMVARASITESYAALVESLLVKVTPLLAELPRRVRRVPVLSLPLKAVLQVDRATQMVLLRQPTMTLLIPVELWSSDALRSDILLLVISFARPVRSPAMSMLLLDAVLVSLSASLLLLCRPTQLLSEKLLGMMMSRMALAASLKLVSMPLAWMDAQLWMCVLLARWLVVRLRLLGRAVVSMLQAQTFV